MWVNLGNICGSIWVTFVGQIKFKLRIKPQLFDLFQVGKITTKFFDLPKVMTTKFLTCLNSVKWLLVKPIWQSLFLSPSI